jgi:alkylation response protein AidB-like acyl-CoA dehydrogenase
MWNASNIGFANGPLLNQGAIEAIELVGSHDQKQKWIPNLVSGKWTGTMNLTEPQAGSDLAQVRTKAVPDGDHHLITGEKIFITFGEHDMAENIVHLVLARLPDAPEGVKGISLFIVPKVLVNDQGALGERNDVVCAGIEHKLGINGNPTCTMKFGEKGKGAIGYLVGEANRGLEYMFIMMNAARFSVGVQGYAVADRAYQHSLEYAKERVQMADAATRSKTPVRIIEHPDVRRMLMWQKANLEAMRALSYVTSASLDFANKHPDEKVRKEHKAFIELMIPIVKGWCTETGVDLCSVALQIFGGMGYVEETGIAQQYRDVRITTIYEGTTGIQALDLVGRKLIRDMGATATTVIKQMEKFAKEAAAHDNADVKGIGEALLKSIATLAEVSQWIGMNAMGDLHKAFACSVPYLKLWGVVAGGWQMARAAKIAADKIAAGDKDPFYPAKITTSKFYASHVLTQGAWYKRQIIDGSGDVMTLPEEAFELDRKTVVTA